jgi:uncharacterized membrane protein YeaQ/YmgE (transglycosylase-associated protein family)
MGEPGVSAASERLAVWISPDCTQEADMSFLALILLGLLAGFIASKIVNKHGEGAMLDILLGIAGAVVGGLLFRIFGVHGVSGLNLHSLIVATAGAVLVLFVYHSLHRTA